MAIRLPSRRPAFPLPGRTYDQAYFSQLIRTLDAWAATVDNLLSEENESYTLLIVCGDETTAITAGTAKVTFRAPRDITLSAVSASLTTAQPSGAIFTVDINVNGVSIFDTTLTIDNTETTSTTATTPYEFTGINVEVVENDVITIDVDQIGTSGATGLKITFIGG